MLPDLDGLLNKSYVLEFLLSRVIGDQDQLSLLNGKWVIHVQFFAEMVDMNEDKLHVHKHVFFTEIFVKVSKIT